ncbi:MAG: ATP-binding protein, partial [Deltaproteobacteria bacterium]|nr:ATP-binding protein [Deltaproteobacteria bacterium]
AINRNRITSIIGPRRAGKTFVCFEIISDLLKQKIPRENIIYMNFEDERLVPLDGRELTYLLDVHAELFEYDQNKQLYCFLDEIQNVPNWSKWVRRTIDQKKNVTIFLTGSSSKMLSLEIATELRGRGTSITIFPYAFAEFLRAHGQNEKYSEKLLFLSQRNIYKKYFNEYFAKGGFPEIIPYKEYKDVLQHYYRTMFTRDIVERFSIKNVRQLEDFLKIQITRFASLSSISNSAKEMKDIGYSLSKNTLVNYLKYAEDIFLLFAVKKFDYKVTRQMRAPHKIYAVDHGLLNAVRFSSSEDRGRILENIAFMELRRRFENIYYHRGAAECDFVVMNKSKVIQCLQACWSIENKETIEREIHGLLEALHVYKLNQGIILTNHEYADLERDGKKIVIRPLWHFALKPLGADD